MSLCLQYVNSFAELCLFLQIFQILAKVMSNFYIYVKNYKFMLKWFGSTSQAVIWTMLNLLQEAKMTSTSIIINIQNVHLSYISYRIHHDVTMVTSVS